MMRNYLITLCLLAICLNGFAQCFSSVWHNPSPQGNDLEKVTWLDASNALAIGDRGALVRTADGGASWQVISGLPEWNFVDMYFTDALTGYACGGLNTSGIIIKTTDSGFTWTTLISGGIGTLGTAGALWFTDANTGYCGTYSAIYRTTDAGATWTSSPTVSFTITDIFFQTPQLGWAIANSRILKTVDGGITWSQVLNGGSNLLSAITFTDSNTGFATTSNSSASYYKTTDGGTTWTLTTIPVAGAIQDIAFQDPLVGFVCSGSFDSYIYKTTDGGGTWGLVYTLSQINRLHSVAISSEGKVASVGNLGALLVSDNAGNSGTWINKRVQLGNGFYCLDMVSDQVGYFGSPGAIWKTTDGGNTLTSTTIPSGTRTPLSMHFPSPDTGYVVGSDGMRYRTYNGGATWSNQTINTTSDIYGVYFLTNQIGYTCGEGGAVGKTTDGWNNISPISIGQNVLLYDVFFLNESHGYVCGANGAFYRTINGGATWTAIPTGTTTQFMLSVFFINDQIGFCSGGGGRMLRTTDGGVTWTTSLVGFGDDIYEVRFVNENEGYYITGQLNGTIYRTWNGGANWYYWGILSNNTLLDFDITEDGSIYVVGFTAALWEVNPTVPTPDVPSSITVCEGNSITIEAPDGFVTEWYSTPLLSNPIVAANTIDYNQLNNATELWVGYVDINLCRSIRVPVTVEYAGGTSLPDIIATRTSLCPGSSATLSTSDNSSVLWSNGVESATIDVSTVGEYAFQIEDPICGTIVSAPIQISEASVPEAPVITVSDYSPCDSVSVIIASTSTDGLVWLDAEGNVLTENTSEYNTPWLQSTTTYIAKAINAEGCISEPSAVTISANLTPVVNAPEPNILQRCTGENVELVVDDAGYDVVWSNGNIGNTSLTDGAGEYSIRYVNGECSSASFTVATLEWTNPVVPVLNATALQFCAGDSVQVTAQSEGSILWNTGQEGNAIWINSNAEVFATATLNGCTGAASQSIVLEAIAAPETPSLSFEAYSPCAPAVVTLQSTSNNTTWLDQNMNPLSSNVATYTTEELSESTIYYGYASTDEGCLSDTATILLPFNIVPIPEVNEGVFTICESNTVTISAASDYEILWSNGVVGNMQEVSIAGAYTAQAVQGTCTSEPSNAIVVTTQPTPATPEFVINGQWIILTNAADNTIQWWQNNTLIEGANNDTLLGAAQPTMYEVQYTNAFNCTSEITVINFIPDNVNEQVINLRMWPNPANDVLYITGTHTLSQLRLRDAQGRTVMEEKVYSTTHTLSTHALTNGYYTLEIITTNGERLMRKVLVQH